jgi:hypothetical protein
MCDGEEVKKCMEECIDIGSLALFISVLVLVHLSLVAVSVIRVFFKKLDKFRNRSQWWQAHIAWVPVGMGLWLSLVMRGLVRTVFPVGLHTQTHSWRTCFLVRSFALALIGTGPGRSLVCRASMSAFFCN